MRFVKVLSSGTRLDGSEHLLPESVMHPETQDVVLFKCINSSYLLFACDSAAPIIN